MKTAIALVYGEGLAQLPSIKAARALGLRVVAVGPDPRLPAMALADERVVVDLGDEAAVLRGVAGYRPEIIVPAPYGMYVNTAGAIVDAYGLPGVGVEASRICQDKWEFHHLLSALGLSSPRQELATSGAEIRAAVSRLGIPCIIKPQDGVGSRGGVVVITDESEVANRVGWHLAERHAHGYTHSLVQQLIPGREYGINAVVSQGELVFEQITVKEMTALPYRQELGHIVDPHLSPGIRSTIVEAIVLVAKALKLQDAVLNADVIFDEKSNPVIVDFTPRIGGFLISNTLLPATSGIDLTREVMRAFLGQEADFTPKFRRAGVLRFHPHATRGRLLNDPDEVNARAVPGVEYLRCPLRAGQKFGEITISEDAWERAMIVTSGTTVADAESAWQQAALALRIMVDTETTLDNLPAVLMEGVVNEPVRAKFNEPAV